MVQRMFENENRQDIYTINHNFYKKHLPPVNRRLVEEASVSQKSRPQLDAHNAKDEKHEKTKEQHISQHGKSVKQQYHQNAHA